MIVYYYNYYNILILLIMMELKYVVQLNNLSITGQSLEERTFSVDMLQN